MNNSLFPTKNFPLYGQRILVTSPRNYASRLASEIINQGGIPIIMSTIETCYLSSYKSLDKFLKNITQFNYIAFTSRNGINAFLSRLEALNMPFSSLGKCQLIAIGKDAQRLEEIGLKISLKPHESSPQGIISELATIVNINKQSILVPIPQVMGISEPDIIPNFITGLQKLGLKVTPVYAYQTRCLDASLYEVEIDLIKQKKVDIIAFSSTAEIEGFLQILNNSKFYKYCIIACFGPYTAANAKKLDLSVDIVAKDYSCFTGFVQAIADYLS
ncbi:MAG: uroporphyrinogen-III synthase [Crocosphaera sp.]